MMARLQLRSIFFALAVALLAGCGPEELAADAEDPATDEAPGETENELTTAIPFTEFTDPLGIGTKGGTEMRRTITTATEYRTWTGHDAPSHVNFALGDVVIVYSGGRRATGGFDPNIRSVRLSDTG